MFVCLLLQHEDLSPMHIKMQAIMTQTNELEEKNNSDKQLWLKQQGTLVEMAQTTEENKKNMQKLEIQYTALQQRKMRFDST